jgi:hypothetical protein
MNFPLSRLCITGIAALYLCVAAGNESLGRLPEIGARVRVTSPKLGAGWHVAMLNQHRVPATCLVVLVFDSPGKNVMTAHLSLDDVTGIQASNLYDGKDATYDASQVAYAGEKWIDVPLKALRAKSNCGR